RRFSRSGRSASRSSRAGGARSPSSGPKARKTADGRLDCVRDSQAALPLRSTAARWRWRKRHRRPPRSPHPRWARSCPSLRALRRPSGNGAASADGRGLMAERAESARELVEKLVLAGVGAVALTAERADALAEEVAARGGLGREEARSLVEELIGRWRGETMRLGERTGSGLAGLFRELGLVTRAEFEELELRVAQVEHRLRL